MLSGLILCHAAPGVHVGAEKSSLTFFKTQGAVNIWGWGMILRLATPGPVWKSELNEFGLRGSTNASVRKLVNAASRFCSDLSLESFCRRLRPS